MGMRVGTGKGEMAEPNVVPFIDVLLVLIIIFMVITPLVPQGLDALVPQPPPPGAPPEEDVLARTIVIQVSRAPGGSGTLLKINQDDVTWDTLGVRLAEIFKTRAEKIAFIKGDEALEFQEVARAIDVAKAAGIEKIGLITAKIEAGE